MSRPSSLRLRTLSAAVSVVVVLVVGACTSDDIARRPAGTAPTTVAPLAQLSAEDDSTPTVPLPIGFVPEDTRGNPLLGLPETPDDGLPALPVVGGEAAISGRVLLPDGAAVPGATVRLERFVGRQGGFVDIGTNDDGEYSADGLLGGHYRVRAWKQPDRATVAPQTTFLEAKGSLTIDVSAEVFEGKRLSAAVVVAEPEVGVATFFEALLVQEDVDEDGIVRGKPIPDAEVSALALEGVRIDSENPAKTDTEGKASFVLMCLTTGEHTVAVYAQELQHAAVLPACQPGTGPVPPPPTTEPDGPTTTVPNPTFAVGGSFTPPFTGPLPVGIYSSSSGSVTCQTSYESWTNGQWVLTRTAGPTIRLFAPARNFRSVGTTRPCTFARVR